MHGVRHAKNPSTIYDPVTINGPLAEVGRCPYCMMDGIYRQIEKPSQYLQHLERHIVEQDSLSCPIRLAKCTAMRWTSYSSTLAVSIIFYSS